MAIDQTLATLAHETTLLMGLPRGFNSSKAFAKSSLLNDLLNHVLNPPKALAERAALLLLVSEAVQVSNLTDLALITLAHSRYFADDEQPTDDEMKEDIADGLETRDISDLAFALMAASVLVLKTPDPSLKNTIRKIRSLLRTELILLPELTPESQ